MNVNRRKRRTAEESKAIVLDTAERRLAQLGLGGLNIVGVAKAAGITHATLIHHFGSSAGMRRALVEHMTARLIDEAMATLNQDAGLSTLFRDLFAVLSTGGHAKLLAWLAIEESHREPATTATRQLFRELIDACAQHLPGNDVAGARNIVTLVVGAAIGLGVAGDALTDLVGMDDEARAQFPDWLASRVGASEGVAF